jgi:hypothetical protein
MAVGAGVMWTLEDLGWFALSVGLAPGRLAELWLYLTDLIRIVNLTFLLRL